MFNLIIDQKYSSLEVTSKNSTVDNSVNANRSAKDNGDFINRCSML